VLPGDVIQHNFIKNGVILHACYVHGHRRGFFQGEALVYFSKSFSRGAKSGEIWFLLLENKKTPFFAEIFKFLPPSDTHACV